MGLPDVIRAEIDDRDQPAADRVRSRFAALERALPQPRSPIAEDLLLRYCAASVEADDAQAEVERMGLIIATKFGLTRNPYIALRDNALKLMAQIAERLDLDVNTADPAPPVEVVVRRVGAQPRFKVATVRKALERSGGSFTGAAALLGCARSTVREYVRRHPTLAKALAEIEEINLDHAETGLLRGLRRGEGWACALMLKTKGKSRGYVERTEVTGKNGAPIQTQAELVVFELPDNGRGPSSPSPA